MQVGSFFSFQEQCPKLHCRTGSEEKKAIFKKSLWVFLQGAQKLTATITSSLIPQSDKPDRILLSLLCSPASGNGHLGRSVISKFLSEQELGGQFWWWHPGHTSATARRQRTWLWALTLWKQGSVRFFWNTGKLTKTDGLWWTDDQWVPHKYFLYLTEITY